jgi:hypothetical protein
MIPIQVLLKQIRSLIRHPKNKQPKSQVGPNLFKVQWHTHVGVEATVRIVLEPQRLQSGVVLRR